MSSHDCNYKSNSGCHPKPIDIPRRLRGSPKNPRFRSSKHKHYEQSLKTPRSENGDNVHLSSNANSFAYSTATTNRIDSVILERTLSGRAICADVNPPFSNEQAAKFLGARDVAVAIEAIGALDAQVHSSANHRLRQEIDTCTILGDDKLETILSCADDLFFRGVLRGRVIFDWSCAEEYHVRRLGTTALRTCPAGYIECLVVLSEPLLRRRGTEKQRTLRVFLHELIHCYLFIRCGVAAKAEGGHTQGFDLMEKAIYRWLDSTPAQEPGPPGHSINADIPISQRYDLFEDRAFPVFDKERISVWQGNDLVSDSADHSSARFSPQQGYTGSKRRQEKRVYVRNNIHMRQHDSFDEATYSTRLSQPTFSHK